MATWGLVLAQISPLFAAEEFTLPRSFRPVPSYNVREDGLMRRLVAPLRLATTVMEIVSRAMPSALSTVTVATPGFTPTILPP